MNEATVKLSTDQTADWANADWRSGYLAGLQRFVGTDIVNVTIESDVGAVLGTYERAWSSV